MAKIIVEKYIELYGEKYKVGDIVPYVSWKDKELHNLKLQVIYTDGVIVLAPEHRESLSECFVIPVTEIDEKVREEEYNLEDDLHEK